MSEEKKETAVETSHNPVPEEEAVEVQENQAEEVKEEKSETAVEEKPETAKEEKSEPVQEEKQEEKPGAKPATKKKDEFVEEVISIKDLKEEGEYSDEESSFLTQMYDRTLNTIAEGEIVKGKILDITDSEVIIDIGFKSEGILPIEEFENNPDLKIGDEVEVYLETVEDINGQLLLSRKRADFIRQWEKVVQKYENDETITGTITRRIKGGMVVSLEGVDAFLPGSQIDVKPIRDFDAYLGRELEFKIVKVNHARKNIVVSSRVLIEKTMESQRSEILNTIEKGQTRVGTVKNITDFGVFIDLGGVDGLLHITDLSWGRVNHPSEVVKLDEQIEVKVLDFNENKDRISLGRKQLLPHPWDNVEEKFPVGAVIKGKVVSLTDYGAFIELETGIEGLIHISEMSWSQHIKHPSQILTVGQEVEAKVLNIESEDKKISLGLKQLEPDPWDGIEEKYPVDSRHKGTVRNLTQFGAFVELEEGIDGLVHISDLSWTKKVRHPGDVVKKGDEIEVVVLGINREERRIALGHKQLEENPWDAFEEQYNVDSEVTGKVVRLMDKGVVVSLPLGVEGFIPNNHLGHGKLKKAADVYHEGDEIPAKVIEFDKHNKRIVLSVTAYFKDREKAELEEYLSKQGLEKTTVEDLLKKEGKPEKKEPARAKKEEKEEKVKEEAAAPAEEQTADEKADTATAEQETAEHQEETKEETKKEKKKKSAEAKADASEAEEEKKEE